MIPISINVTNEDDTDEAFLSPVEAQPPVDIDLDTMPIAQDGYYINGTPDFTLTEFMRAMKSSYPEIELFNRNVIVYRSLKEFMYEHWESVEPYTVREALKEPNTEKRRALFACIKPENYFKELPMELMDRQTVHKHNQQWDKNELPYMVEIDDTYELYRIKRTELFPEDATEGIIDRWGGRNSINVLTEYLYLVRCWCTSTQREYWLFVDNIFVKAESRYDHKLGRNIFTTVSESYDAIEAIAWTIRIDMPWDKVQAIYRQGDLIIAKAIDGYQGERMKSVTGYEIDDRVYHLTKERYLEKMYAES